MAAALRPSALRLSAGIAAFDRGFERSSAEVTRTIVLPSCEERMPVDALDRLKIGATTFARPYVSGKNPLRTQIIVSTVDGSPPSSRQPSLHYDKPLSAYLHSVLGRCTAALADIRRAHRSRTRAPRPRLVFAADLRRRRHHAVPRLFAGRGSNVLGPQLRR